MFAMMRARPHVRVSDVPPGNRMKPTNPPGREPQVPASPKVNLPPRRSWLIFLALLFVNYLVMRFLFPGPGDPITIPYTVFKEQAAKQNVQAIYSRGTSIEG